jgi:hypothetical protein
LLFGPQNLGFQKVVSLEEIDSGGHRARVVSPLLDLLAEHDRSGASALPDGVLGRLRIEAWSGSGGCNPFVGLLR